MADENTQDAVAAVAEAEDQSPEAARAHDHAEEAEMETVEPDRQAQTAHKPPLSDEERLQGLEPDKLAGGSRSITQIVDADVDGEVAIDAAEAALRAAMVAPPAPRLVQLGSL